MTRGKIVLITNDKLLTSVEFNGDMYVEHGHGEQLLEDLPNINTEEEYRDYVVAFDSENFCYATESKRDGVNYFDNEYFINGVADLTNDEEMSVSDYLDFTSQYFEKWFSDYVYIKNISDHEEEIICTYKVNYEENNVKAKIMPNGIAVLCFGEIILENSTGVEIDDSELVGDSSFSGYWEMTSHGIVVYDTDHNLSYDLTEVDGDTIEHIVDYVRDGYVRGDLCDVYLQED